jgi:hypothetical protein
MQAHHGHRDAGQTQFEPACNYRFTSTADSERRHHMSLNKSVSLEMQKGEGQGARTAKQASRRRESLREAECPRRDSNRASVSAGSASHFAAPKPGAVAVARALAAAAAQSDYLPPGRWSSRSRFLQSMSVTALFWVCNMLTYRCWNRPLGLESTAAVYRSAWRDVTTVVGALPFQT